MLGLNRSFMWFHVAFQRRVQITTVTAPCICCLASYGWEPLVKTSATVNINYK